MDVEQGAQTLYPWMGNPFTREDFNRKRKAAAAIRDTKRRQRASDAPRSTPITRPLYTFAEEKKIIEKNYSNNEFTGEWQLLTTDGSSDPAKIVPPNTITLGAGSAQRDGKQAKMLSFHAKGNIYLPPKDLDLDFNSCSNMQIRIVWVMDTSAVGLYPAADNVFSRRDPYDQNGNNKGIGTDINNFRNLDIKGKYVFLADDIIDWHQEYLGFETGGTGDTKMVRQEGKTFNYSTNKDWSKMPPILNFKGVTDDKADLLSNAIHCFYVASLVGPFENGKSLSFPSMNLTTRVRFEK